jgi:hypothetical protein
MSTDADEVRKAFQPPLSGGSFLARRLTSVCQSIDTMSTGARLARICRSWECISTTSVPS